MPTRRRFLQTAAAAAATTIAPRAQTAESRIEILLSEPIGTIAPEIYSHFVEHLGGVVYDGIWVGENSRIPNIGGIRKELAEALARTKPGAIRWPGGCFADQYDWRDGIGPRDKRPRRTNFWVDSRSGPDPRSATAHRSTIPTTSGPPNSSGSASWPAASRTSRRTSAAFRRRSSGVGWSTATRPRVPPPLPTSARATDRATRSTSATGVLATNHGAAAATSRPRTTPPSTAATAPGCRAMACRSP